MIDNNLSLCLFLEQKKDKHSFLEFLLAFFKPFADHLSFFREQNKLYIISDVNIIKRCWYWIKFYQCASSLLLFYTNLNPPLPTHTTIFTLTSFILLILLNQGNSIQCWNASYETFFALFASILLYFASLSSLNHFSYMRKFIRESEYIFFRRQLFSPHSNFFLLQSFFSSVFARASH
jgi:hypothetical protein